MKPGKSAVLQAGLDERGNSRSTTQPKLSILIVTYNMQREAPRTIASALPPYQKRVSASDYEVLILDNGSSQPLAHEYIADLPANVRYLPVPEPNGSPGHALNWGATQARSDILMFCIDGARILSDGLVYGAIANLDRFPDAFVYTLGWHLGSDVQMRSVLAGYDALAEDKLLSSANWYEQPERLFEISVLAGSSVRGLSGQISESNAFAVSRSVFETIGGYDERFIIPGGSTSNLELFERYVTRENAINILLAGEGTFHQVHGGSATSNPDRIEAYFDEYQQIFGRKYKLPHYETMIAGWPQKTALPALMKAAQFVSSEH